METTANTKDKVHQLYDTTNRTLTFRNIGNTIEDSQTSSAQTPRPINHNDRHDTITKTSFDIVHVQKLQEKQQLVVSAKTSVYQHRNNNHQLHYEILAQPNYS